jgi:ATP-dependent RNA helicase DDX10/DBP4
VETDKVFLVFLQRHTSISMPSKQKNRRRSSQHSSSSQNVDQQIAILRERIRQETPAPGSAAPTGVVAFASLPLSELTLRGLAETSYTTMTDIQKASIPHALAGRDVMGAAKTGSGKTLSFVVPILECLFKEQWSKQDGPGAIVLSPTRELAGQIFAVLRRVGKHHTQLSAGLLVGGKHDFMMEQQHVPTTNILIATPGRLLQHLEQTPYFEVGNLKMLCLDEADRILDMGFRDQLLQILDYLPKESRQTLLFSATQTKNVKHLVTLGMNRKNLEYVGVYEKEATDMPEALKQAYVCVPLQHKLNCLYSFIKTHLKGKTIVFFASCAQVRHAWSLFCSLRPGISVMALHGKLVQSKRSEIYDKFTSQPNAVLFATDVASRGLDFPAVDWVVQVDAPEDQDMYIHRVGRTARYKNKGNSLLLLDPLEEPGFQHWTISQKVKKKSINPTKTVLVTQKAAALVAEDVTLNTLAKKAFSSYVRSLALLPKLEFDIRKLELAEYATSLGLASMPNLRFLEKVTSREGLRKTKNVNKKLQKLKEQIKAEKLAKKLAKMGKTPEDIALEQDKKRKLEDEEDELLVVKSRVGPEDGGSSDDEVPDDYDDLHKVAKSRHPKKIRVEGSTSDQNKHVVFDDDGHAVENDIITMAASNNDVEDDADRKEKDDLAMANEEYMKQVRDRLERSKEQDRQEEKERVRERHRKKRMQEKGERPDVQDVDGPVAVLGGSPGNADDASQSSSSSSEGGSASSDDDDASSSSDEEDMDVAAQEDLALSLIRGS